MAASFAGDLGSNGRLGNDAAGSTPHPVAVVDGDDSTTPLSGIVQISAGGSHSCALKEDGGVLCWGLGSNGRLGNDDTDDKDHPVAVVDGDDSSTPLSGIVQVSADGFSIAGSTHSCALKDNGGLLCWGAGGHGRLGNDATGHKDHPVTVVGEDTDDPLDNNGNGLLDLGSSIKSYFCQEGGKCSLD